MSITTTSPPRPNTETPLLARAAWSRKAGRYDCQRFSHLSSTGVSVGHRAIDKVNVDCCFLFRRSQWGTLGHERNPAGIIYMDLTFDQPADCKLVNAKVRVTLDEEHRGLWPFRDMRIADSGCPVQITDWFGPKQFGGVAKMKAVKKTVHATPSVNVLGSGAGGVGVDFETAFAHTSRWTFKGSRQTGKGGRSPTWNYRRLTWELTENDLEKHSTHSNKVHTAFAYENSGQPFLMKVEISGQLVKTRRQLKEMAKGLMKFGPHKKEDTATTLVGASYGRRRRLDERARDLERAMELENQNSIPIEMPDSLPASFQPLPYEPDRSNISDSDYVISETDTAAEATLFSNKTTGRLESQPPQVQLDAAEAPGLLEDRRLPTSTNPTDPTLANLARIGAYFAAPERKPRIIRNRSRSPSGNCSEASGHSSGTTLVNSPTGHAEVATQVEEKGSVEKSACKKKRWLSMTGRRTGMDLLRILFWYLISFLSIFGSIPWHDRASGRESQHMRQSSSKSGA